MPDPGYLHKRSKNFGKCPSKLMHDLDLTDGAVRLYAHMHWRYSSNCQNWESQDSMATYMGVSEKAIANRIKELESKDWIVAIYRGVDPKTGRHQTMYYHVFEMQSDCIAFRKSYKAQTDERIREKAAEVHKRVSRKGKGGNPNVMAASGTQVQTVTQRNSGSDGQRNSGSDGQRNSGSDELEAFDSEAGEQAPSQKPNLTPSKETPAAANATPQPPIAAPPPSPLEFDLERVKTILAMPSHIQNFEVDSMRTTPIIDAYERAIGAPMIASRNQKLAALKAQVAGYTPDEVFDLVTRKTAGGEDYPFAWMIADLPTSRKKSKPAPIQFAAYVPLPQAAPLTKEQIEALKAEVMKESAS